MAGVEARGGGAPSLGLSADVTADIDGRHSGGEDIADDECSDAGSHRCPRCDYDTLSRHAFVAHVAECAGDNMGEGSVGDNGDGSPDRMNRKIFECDVCNMKFSNGANMRRHKMRHTGVKPYECRVCQKRFFRKDHLAEHFTTHTKTLPYHCPICNRGFQRQIAMRAHFQNEHVGQHDMVKSCPLCSYRAGSMKSLRVHFYNRHGIDLDNPGPTMGVDSNANAAINGGLGATLGSAIAGALSGTEPGDSTPPMHFLTPHIEISMADPPTAYSPAQSDHANGGSDMNGECPSSPQSADSSCAPTTTASTTTTTSATALLRESPDRCLSGNITINGSSALVSPSISLIPIKQEPSCDMSVGASSGSGSGEEGDDDKRCTNGPVNLTTARGSSVGSGAAPPAHSGNNLTALIKVSPLKSLLRDDGKRSRHIPPRPRSELLPAPPGSRSSLDGPPPDPAGLTSNPASWRSPPKLQCAFCGIAFPDQTLYFLHKGCHSDTNPWKCNICGEQCCSVYDFNAHLLSKSHQ